MVVATSGQACARRRSEVLAGDPSFLIRYFFPLLSSLSLLLDFRTVIYHEEIDIAGHVDHGRTYTDAAWRDGKQRSSRTWANMDDAPAGVVHRPAKTSHPCKA